jgi:hypothetical protein
MKMRGSTFLYFFFMILILAGCNFSAGVNKDLITGLYYSNNGFSVSGVYFVGPDNTPLKSNRVSIGTSIAIVIEGIENYVMKDEKAFPGLSLTVTDDQGGTVLNNDDLFAEGEGYSSTDASILRGTLTVGDPMVAGKTYHVKLNVWDKNKKENTITAEIDIEVE